MLDEKRNTSVERAVLLLTRSEAEELRDSLEAILAKGEGQHSHVPSEDYQHEITVALYDAGDVSGFNLRCQRLIQENA